MWCIVASYVSTAITAWGGTSMTHETQWQIHPLASKINVYQCERKITKSLKSHLFYLELRSDIWYQRYLVLYPNNGMDGIKSNNDGIKSNNHSPTDAPKPFSCLHTPTIWLQWLVKPRIIIFLKDSTTTEAPTMITSLFFFVPPVRCVVFSMFVLCSLSLSYAKRPVLCDNSLGKMGKMMTFSYHVYAPRLGITVPKSVVSAFHISLPTIQLWQS